MRGGGGGGLGALRTGAEVDVDTEHVTLADTNLVEGFRGDLEELIVEDELLGIGGDGGFAVDDVFEELYCHVAANLEVDDIRVRLLGTDDTNGDPPGWRRQIG